MRVTPRQSIVLMWAIAGLFALFAALGTRAAAPWPAWLFGALSALSAGLALAMWRNPQLASEAAAAFATPEEGQWLDPEDPLLLEARARARQSVERMLALHSRHRDKVLVKLAFKTDNGEVERVWAELGGVQGNQLRVRLVSRPLAQDGPVPDELRVPMEEIDDWVLQEDAGVHGAWSVQAELAIAQRSRRPVPAHVAEMRGRFLDPLEP